MTMSPVVGKSESPADDGHEMSKLKLDRLKKLAQLKEAGVNPYAYSFERTHKAAQLQELYKDLANGVETQDVVKVCGRIHNERNTWLFVDVYDDSGKIQLFCHKESLSEEKLKMLKLLD